VFQAGDRWRINGVIDWETTTTGSPLVDIGSLFRYSRRYDAAFCDAFAAGYRDAGGTLPDDWLKTARLLDATWLIDMLDDDDEHTRVFSDCKTLVANLVTELRA
jgi:aminoglycoside phosphotransferase (APT) family kinase protein